MLKMGWIILSYTVKQAAFDLQLKETGSKTVAIETSKYASCGAFLSVQRACQIPIVLHHYFQRYSLFCVLTSILTHLMICTQKLENHCYDVTSPYGVKIFCTIIYCLGDQSSYLPVFLISFLQTTVHLYHKPTEQPGVQGFGLVVSPISCQINRLLNGNFHPFE